jgi:hypothetical protein
MASFKFSFVVKPATGIAFTKHIELAQRDTCIAIICQSPDGECTHLLEPADYASFAKALVGESKLNVFDAVQLAVGLGQEPLVDEKVHSIVKPDFVWYDFDSPFYGDVYIESILDEDGKWIRVN